MKREVKVIDNIIHKKCTVCLEFKAITEFHLIKSLNHKGGIQDKCKECINEYWRERYKLNPELNREIKLRKTYDISTAEYEKMYHEQEGKCLICKQLFEILHVDHCHKTAVVRGLLCRSCNTGLGLLKDDIELLNNAIEYLTGYNDGTEKIRANITSQE